MLAQREYLHNQENDLRNREKYHYAKFHLKTITIMSIIYTTAGNI